MALRERTPGPNHSVSLASLTLPFVHLVADRHADTISDLLAVVSRLEAVFSAQAADGDGSAAAAGV